MNPRGNLLVLTLLAALGSPLAICAADADIWSRDKLLGDMGGLRSGLGAHGVALDLRLTQFYQSVVKGDLNENDEYGGKADYILNVDGEKLGLWKGLFLNFHAETQFGDSVEVDAGPLALSNEAMLYPLPADERTELTGWVVAQGLYQKGDTAVLVNAGKLHIGDLINTVWPYTELGGDGFMNYNISFPLMPFAMYLRLSHLGASAMVLKNGVPQAAALVLDTHNSSTTSGFDDLGDNGLIGLFLYRFFFDIDDKPGRLTFIGGFSSGRYTTFQETVWVAPFTFVTRFGRRTRIFAVPGLEEEPKRYPWTVLAYYDQILWQADPKGQRNIRFVAAGAVADTDLSYANWQFTGQLVATGYFDNRPLDKIGIGGHYVDLNNRAKNTAEDSPLLPSLSGYGGVELFYTAAITPAARLTGDIQILDHPLSDADVAVIPGVRLMLDF